MDIRDFQHNQSQDDPIQGISGNTPQTNDNDSVTQESTQEDTQKETQDKETIFLYDDAQTTDPSGHFGVSNPEGTIFLRPSEGPVTTQENQNNEHTTNEFHTEIPLDSFSNEKQPLPELTTNEEMPKTEVTINNFLGHDMQPNETPSVEQTTIEDAPPPTVVDTRTNHEELHHIETKADIFTLEADKEEEEFIQEVEKHHEHQ